MNHRPIPCAALSLGAAVALLSCAAARSEARPAGGSASMLQQQCEISLTAANKDEWMRAPDSASSVTRHRVVVDGRPLDYTATAGLMALRDDRGKPIANIGYIAYTKRDVKDPGSRPILFFFNGGPGSSSLWLDIGGLGPKRVVTSDHTMTPPPPYQLVDNPYTVLGKTDLVMIDPVGTGLSHAVCGHSDKEFWSVDSDIDSVSRFIAQYVSGHDRWNSPKYLLGESYGTTRAAGIAEWLRVNRSLDINGVILSSVAIDFTPLVPYPGNELPYPAFLPTYAAVAWYHHRVPNQPASLETFVAQARAFAMGPFAAALRQGDALNRQQFDAIAQKVHDFTGLPTQYIEDANLRIPPSAFQVELLKSQGLTVGRLDGRFTGPTMDLLEEDATYDPQSSAISAAYTAAFLTYLHDDLKFGQGMYYEAGSHRIAYAWNETHHPIDDEHVPQPMVNTGVDLAHALAQDTNLRVLVLNGYYDLATPFAATEYVMDHLNLPPAVRSHILFKYYRSGHMIYAHLPALEKMSGDIDAFIDSTIGR